MCGIVGVFAFSQQGKLSFSQIDKAIESLRFRGPDDKGKYIDELVALGHTRLSIIDTSAQASQPFVEDTGRYVLVYNGEIFNFIDLRLDLSEKGVKFKSTSDTEVLMHLLISEGVKALDKLNGFYAFAFYDKLKGSVLLARDRMGVKPLLFYRDNDKLLFASEMKALMAMGIDKNIDEVSVYQYLQLNYIPVPFSIFKDVQKLDAGHYIFVSKDSMDIEKYYTLPQEIMHEKHESVKHVKHSLYEAMEQAVLRRLVADVPLGAFLSGGLDSSIIVALASKHTKHLQTFSIGFKDNPLFDETGHAEQVAMSCGTEHTSFMLNEDDLFAELFSMLDYIDEPFADSSALPVYILCKNTRKHVTVALSGDGADELFGGYNKHMAEFRARNKGVIEKAACALAPLLKGFPQSRYSMFSNKIRQIVRFADGLNMSESDRYWRWCSFVDEVDALSFIKTETDLQKEYNWRKHLLTNEINKRAGMNDVFAADVNMVLQSDMLVKVDMMSMANSLEVRNPFLDKEVVELAFSISSDLKIHKGQQKYILKETFGHLLPDAILQRQKHGFEVPLLKWFRGGLKHLLIDDLLADDFIKIQNIFNPETINVLKKQLFSSNPKEVHAQMWALLVFQYWWKKNCK